MALIDLTAAEAHLVAPRGGDGGTGNSDLLVEPRYFDRDQVITHVASAIAALAFTWLVYERLTVFSGDLGFLVVWWVSFTGFVYVTSRQQWGSVVATNNLVRVVVTSAAALALIPLAAILLAVIVRGWRGMQISFLTTTMRTASTESKFSQGGAWHAIVGTLEVVGLAALMSVPLGIMTAVFLNEVGGRLAMPVRMLTDAMSAIPSIVAGLFIFAVLIQSHYLDQTGFSGALALSILMLPTVTRTAEVVLRLVPGGLREASLALGSTEWRTTKNVVLPTARTGLVTAVVLGVARIIGETAPLIVTMLGSQLFNANPFANKQDALPIYIWTQKLTSTGDNTVTANWMWAGAFVLMVLVLILFVTARILGNRTVGVRRG
ncbi:MAG TPA: phosphate ABC transporter permease PstA [Acidimicrobiia bacterium]|jgi:phosphate transport system permease protein